LPEARKTAKATKTEHRLLVSSFAVKSSREADWMSSWCPVLVVLRALDGDAEAVARFRALVEGSSGAAFGYEFHLLQATAATGRAVQQVGAQVILGYATGTRRGEPVILARDATVRACEVHGGRCRLQMKLLPGPVLYQPGHVSLPESGKLVFMIAQPHRLLTRGRRQYPRWVCRLGLFLFERTGWLCWLRLVRTDGVDEDQIRPQN
jgi:hypothetical protein